MPALARKITRAKWDPRDELALGEISSDAVTADLKTTQNCLSFWTCPDGERDLEDAVLALAAAMERPDKIDIAWLAQEEAMARGLTIATSPGQTPVASLVHRHVDIARLDLVRLGTVAHLIADAVQRQHCRRFLKNELIGLLVRAVNNQRLELDALQPLLRAAVETAMNRAHS